VSRDDRLFLKLAATGQYVVRLLDRQLAPAGIPPYLLALVTHVHHHQPVTPSAVAAASGIPPTTLRDNVQRLVERGLARRVPNPADGRSYLLELTDRGESIVREADPALAAAYAGLARRLPRPLAAYEQLIDELNSALEASVGGA
jgi:DNA-binding MarR family transcriptional regulator